MKKIDGVYNEWESLLHWSSQERKSAKLKYGDAAPISAKFGKSFFKNIILNS